MSANAAVARRAFVSCALVGQSVVVHLIDGTICEGLMIGALDETLALGSLRFKRSRVHEGVALAEFFEATLLIPWDHVLMLSAARVSLDLGHDGVPLRPSFGPQQRWADAVDDVLGEDLEGGATAKSHAAGGWDQFETNKKKFGVTSTYDENLYTTRLDTSKLTPAQMREADRLTREINERDAISDQHAIERGTKALEVDDAVAWVGIERMSMMIALRFLRLRRASHSRVPKACERQTQCPFF